jgi:hypothetical protein
MHAQTQTTAPQPTEQTAWASARIARRLDTETAAWLRASLLPEFNAAQTLSGLKHRLALKGFYLSQGDAETVLRDCHSRVAVCTLAFLGLSQAALTRRFSDA